MSTQKFRFVVALLAALPAAYPVPASPASWRAADGSGFRLLDKNSAPHSRHSRSGHHGDPFKTELDLRRVSISPQQDYALASQGAHNEIVVLRFDRAAMTSTPVPDTHRGPVLMVFSPGGRVAAIHYKDRNRIQVLSGLPASPKVVDELYLTAALYPRRSRSVMTTRCWRELGPRCSGSRAAAKCPF